MNKEVRQTYLAGWFPGTKVENTKDIDIVSCIILSHRLFSGSNFDGVAVRDFRSFSMLMEENNITFGVGDPGEETKIVRHSMLMVS